MVILNTNHLKDAVGTIFDTDYFEIISHKTRTAIHNITCLRQILISDVTKECSFLKLKYCTPPAQKSSDQRPVYVSHYKNKLSTGLPDFAPCVFQQTNLHQ